MAMTIAEDQARIRPARPDDAAAIAAVHVAAWRESYAGLVPPEMLASLSVAERAERWRHILRQSDPVTGTADFVAQLPDGRVTGFASCGRQRSAGLAEAGFGGEVQAIYVLRTAQRRGLGRALMGVMARTLRERGFQGVALWVLAGNRPALDFYGRLGGGIVAQRQDAWAEGVILAELAYGWASLAALATAAP